METSNGNGKMVVQQSAAQRNQRIALRALYATLGVACGIEIYAMLHEQTPRVLTLEYILVYATGFVLAFTFVWLTAKRNLRISISQMGVEMSHDEDMVRFAWHELKHAAKPNVLRRHWLFELNNAKRIKISTRYFSRKQIKQINRFISQVTATYLGAKSNVNSNHIQTTESTLVQPRITHPRIVDPHRH